MNKYEMYIHIQLRDSQNGGTLNVSESVTITASNFLELAKILGQFHELAEKIRASR
jgi:hypothetical protein